MPLHKPTVTGPLKFGPTPKRPRFARKKYKNTIDILDEPHVKKIEIASPYPKPTEGWPKFEAKDYHLKDHIPEHIPAEWMVNLVETLPKRHFGNRDTHKQSVHLHEDDHELLLTDFEFEMLQKKVTVREVLGEVPPWFKNPVHKQQERNGVHIPLKPLHEAYEFESLMKQEVVQCALISQTFDQVKKTTTHHPYNKELQAVKEYPVSIVFGGELGDEIERFFGEDLDQNQGQYWD
ncbi:hypothetical protein L596_000305 [Steinernema carpocapsae]|uniref:Uncharacterized protein n=1 Tax=Steinernema carpocapsae TaxID=34508 RepID=A0A4U8UK65_STECR|nr:hypothetical protein L596_000305 [Steinernema carpocapsae]